LQSDRLVDDLFLAMKQGWLFKIGFAVQAPTEFLISAL